MPVKDDSHKPYDEPPKQYGLTRRVASSNKPAPTIVATDVDTPFIPQQHEVNNVEIRPTFASSQIVAKPSQPSPIIVSHDGSAPFMLNAAAATDYPAFLASELPISPPPSNGWKLASFFCGCGGVDLGFRSAGINLVFANDLYLEATQTFAKNLQHAPMLADIRTVQAEHVPQGCDVVTGGFPCVTFSMAGKRAGVEDSINGKLYLELCRVIQLIKPRYFVAENVRGMLSSNGGRDVKLILAAFLRMGYRTSYELVNMAEYGVPQTRQRVIFVGVRLDQWRGQFRFPSKTHRLKGSKPGVLPFARSVREAVGDLPAPNEQVLANLHGDAAAKMKRGVSNGYQNSQPRVPDQPAHSQTTHANVFLVAVKPDESSPTADHAPNNEPISRTYASSQRVAKPDEPSPTAVSEAANVQPFLGLRRMTVRECARVQTFPDWFLFQGSQADGYKQVGNAVPPLYAKQLARALIHYNKRKILAR